jgi:molybdopterin molybdotransferase
MTGSPFGGMRPLAAVITLDEALAIVRQAVRPVTATDQVPLAEATARVLATDVVAPFDVPGFDRAAMDGYAVRAADVAGASVDHPVTLRLGGVSRPGSLPSARCDARTCVEIATGAPVPDGADAVVMVERTAREGTHVAVQEAAAPGQHISPRGHDVQEGQRVLAAGAHLSPGRVGLLASLGLATVAVLSRPVVAIVSSGDELLRPGDPPQPGRIHDANTFTLDAVCRAHGAATRLLPPVGDALEAWHRALDAAGDAQLVISSGGSSVGERDLLLDVVHARGEVLFHGLAVKPGKPTMFARLAHQLLLGMPGNPTSCLSNAYVLLIPLLRALAGLPPHRPETREARLTRAVTSPASRLQFYQVCLRGEEAVPVFRGSGDITSLADADGYIEVPIGIDRLEAGARVRVILY